MSASKPPMAERTRLRGMPMHISCPWIMVMSKSNADVLRLGVRGAPWARRRWGVSTGGTSRNKAPGGRALARFEFKEMFEMPPEMPPEMPAATREDEEDEEEDLVEAGGVVEAEGPGRKTESALLKKELIRVAAGRPGESQNKLRPGEQRLGYGIYFFVLDDLSLNQRSVRTYKFYKSRESHLSTLLYIVSSSAQHFPPVPPAPLGRPRPPGADRSRSGFIQGQRAPVVLLSRPSTRPERGNHGPVICCEVADKNQYNKLLGIVKITVEEFGTDHTHTVKYLILRMSECQVVYRSEPVGPGLLNPRHPFKEARCRVRRSCW